MHSLIHSLTQCTHSVDGLCGGGRSDLPNDDRRMLAQDLPQAQPVAGHKPLHHLDFLGPVLLAHCDYAGENHPAGGGIFVGVFGCPCDVCVGGHVFEDVAYLCAFLDHQGDYGEMEQFGGVPCLDLYLSVWEFFGGEQRDYFLLLLPGADFYDLFVLSVWGEGAVTDVSSSGGCDGFQVLCENECQHHAPEE